MSYHDEDDGMTNADCYEPKTGICASCGRECEEETSDEGIGPYEFWGSRGVHHDYQQVSSCCGEAVYAKGKVYLDRHSVHTARKDHVDKYGKVVISKGQRYSKHILKSYAVDENGKHLGFISIKKTLLAA